METKIYPHSAPERGRERGGRQVEESDAQRPRPWDEIEGEEGPWQTHNNKSSTSVQRCNTEYFEKKIHLKISYALGNGNFYHFNSTMGEFPSVDSPPSPSSFLHTPYFPSFFPPVVTRKTPLPPLFPAVFFCSLLRSPPPPPFFHRAECFTPACIFNKVGLNAPSRPLPRLSCFCGNVPSLVLQDVV